MPKTKVLSRVTKSIPFIRRTTRPIVEKKSCLLRRFVGRKFLRKNNLELTDVRCKYTSKSRNCGVKSSLTFVCRRGFVFANRKQSVISRCDSEGQWTSITPCIPTSRINLITVLPKKISLRVQKPRYRFRKGVSLVSYPSTCPLKPFVTRRFLRSNNLRLVDIRCKHSWNSKNCGQRSVLTYVCREGFVFSNKRNFAVSTCNSQGQWTNIFVCVPSDYHFNSI